MSLKSSRAFFFGSQHCLYLQIGISLVYVFDTIPFRFIWTLIMQLSIPIPRVLDTVCRQLQRYYMAKQVELECLMQYMYFMKYPLHKPRYESNHILFRTFSKLKSSGSSWLLFYGSNLLEKKSSALKYKKIFDFQT